VAHLYRRSPLKAYFDRGREMNNKACAGILSCNTRFTSKCNLPRQFGMQSAKEWIPPNYTLGEGPVIYGSQHPFCQDCTGCDSGYTLCNFHPNFTSEISQIPPACSQNLHHGDFFGVEFARDKEIQTPEYGTTQEAIQAFIRQRINHDEKLNQLVGGLPVCLISMGLHDMIVPNITKEVFGDNAKWFLQLLTPLCTHIIWLPNAAPFFRTSVKYYQSQQSVAQYNDLVTNQVIPELVSEADDNQPVGFSVLDVWNASLGWPHRDNVHMNNDWYHSLGSFLVELALQNNRSKRTID